MRLQCDVCERNLAAVMCCADEAALCVECDLRVHAANKLANKHQRVALLPSAGDPPTCDICQEKSAFFFCLEDRALLCRDCDVSIHLAGSLSASHKRFLLTGTRVALEAVSNDCPADSNEDAQAVPASIASPASTSGPPSHHSSGRGQQGRGPSPLAYARANVSGVGGGLPRRGSMSDMMADPGWRVDEILNIPELADGYTLADIGSNKAEDISNLGDFDWTADLSLFDEHVYAESMHEVPQLPMEPPLVASGSGLGRSSRASGGALKSRARHDDAALAVVPDYADAFVVPDLSMSAPSTSAPPSKRRRGLM
eukprot:jgi/Mesen1/5820/ME000296S05105